VKNMPHVISASRRTDIPAFYADWFVNRLKAGRVFVLNPYTRKPFLVSLHPVDVNAIVFWSKNYSPLLNKLEAVERTTKNLLFHFSITANKELESGTPDIKDAVRDYLFLARRYSPEQVIWRYDPVCITDKLPFAAFQERFVHCAELLKGYANKCFISFAHPYKKVIRNLHQHSKQTLVDLSQDKKREYAFQLAETAQKYGIQLFACCNDYLVDGSIQKARCIDGPYLSTLFRTAVDTRPAHSRKECACTRSMDIGAYDTCAHGCSYCYATTNHKKAVDALHRHDPEWNSLTRQIDESELPAAGKQIILDL